MKYKVTVKGRYTFPIDMLRYDSASPYRETDSSAIVQQMSYETHDKSREITVLMPRRPTAGRWESFGYQIVNVEQY